MNAMYIYASGRFNRFIQGKMYEIVEKFSKQEIKIFLKRYLPNNIPRALNAFFLLYIYPNNLNVINRLIELKSDTLYEFDNILIKSYGEITTNEYDSKTKKGGKLFLKIKNKIELHESSEINVSGLGYKGGHFYCQGYSYKGRSLLSHRNNNGGGGGSSC